MVRVNIIKDLEVTHSGLFLTEQEAISWIFEDSQPWSEKLGENNVLKEGFSYETLEE